jgi:hypothetical protein
MSLDQPHIACEARFGAWSSIRKIAHDTGCTLTEKRLGLMTRRFVMHGDDDALGKFAAMAYHHPIVGPQFREAYEKRYNEACRLA